MQPFPVFRLNDAITEAISKMISIDIEVATATGLHPEIRFMDEQGPITTVAKICESPIDGKHHVTISAAFAQFLWLLGDIAFRIHENNAINIEFENLSKEEQEQFILHLDDDNEESHYVKALFNRKTVLEHAADSTNQIVNLFNRQIPEEEMKELYKYDMTSGIGIRVNSLYVYAMTFILLHEFSHHSLGHDFRAGGSVDEEIAADQNAFWALYSDLKDKEQRTAKRGILCALVSLLFLNKNLEDDGIHQRPVERVFTYYELMQDEGEDYSALLCYLLYAWAVYAKDDGMPTLDERTSYVEVLGKMKKHLMEMEERNN